MKIQKVTVEGFGPFKTKQVVDFAKYEDEGLFLIVGPTGAGKSSILDAITYALYGKTPRWTDTTITKKNWSARSDYCSPGDDTSVALEFSDGDELFKIERSIKVAKATGKETEECSFYRWKNDDWKGEASKAKAVDAEVKKYIGLDEKEFLQVILLAQGRFDKALKASSEERLELMRALFKTEHFRRYTTNLERIAKESGTVLRDAKLGVETEKNILIGALGFDISQELDFQRQIPDAISALKADLEKAEKAQKVADAKAKTASQILENAKAKAEYDDATSALAELAKAEPEISLIRARVDTANRASRVEALINQWVDAQKAKSKADQELTLARTNFSYTTEDSDLKSKRDSLIALKSKLESKIDLADDLAKNQGAVLKLNGELTSIAGGLATKQGQIDDLKAERQSIQSLANDLEMRKTARDVAKSLFEKSSDLVDAEKQRTRLFETANICEIAATTATSNYDTTLKGYLNTTAARLASELKPGEACQVCGSTTHPAKHSAAKDQIDEQQLETVRIAADEANAALARAMAELKSCEEEVNQFKEFVGGSTHDQIQHSLQSAELALTEAENAHARVVEIASQIDGDDAPLVVERTELNAALQTVKHQLNTASETVNRIETELKELLESHATVSAYLDATNRELSSTEALLAALGAVESATALLTTSESAAVKKAKLEKFESIDEAKKGVLSNKELEDLNAQIDGHNNSLVAQKAILEQPRLQNLPGDLPTLEVAKTALETARENAQVAAELSGSLREKHASAESQYVEIQSKVAELTQLQKDADLKLRLYKTFDGQTPNTKNMQLEVYYMAAELESVLEAANLRLKTLSRGRFSLMHTDQGLGRSNAQAGLGIEVMDENTGKPFDPHRFSGGETFLASLSLALGLAEVVTSRNGGVKIDTLFVDEGFGSLSGEPLEDAMAVLESLRQGGRTVGLISHVESMKERIPTQLKVEKTSAGYSKIAQ